MLFFRRRKLKRVQKERSKVSTRALALREIKTPTSTNLLAGILFSLLIFGLLGGGYLDNLTDIIAISVVIFLSVFLLGGYLFSFQPHLFSSMARFFSFALLGVSLLFFVELFGKLGWTFYFLPVVFISMIISIGYSRQLAIIILLFQFFVIWMVRPEYFPEVIIHFPAAVVVILGLAHFRTRGKIIRLGGIAGFLLLVIIFIQLILDPSVKSSFPGILYEFRNEGLLGLANGIISGFILLGILPILERWLGIMTDLSLLELSDMNQPLLKELSLTAPGTYHHSLRVGNLAEAAAEAIGANSMLARVGAYYHDIGKLNKPEYFVENEADMDSKHNELSPAMSTLIITAHVKDGLELAKYHRLPRAIKDFIIQHHGTSLIKYFFNEAREKNNHHTKEASPEESAFRYPGPKPRNKEVVIVLLADAIEATSRILSQITPAKIKNLVHEIVVNRFLDGQLDQSNLTIWELKKVEETFIRVLAGIFHARIKYPEISLKP